MAGSPRTACPLARPYGSTSVSDVQLARRAASPVEHRTRDGSPGDLAEPRQGRRLTGRAHAALSCHHRPGQLFMRLLHMAHVVAYLERPYWSFRVWRGWQEPPIGASGAELHDTLKPLRARAPPPFAPLTSRLRLRRPFRCHAAINAGYGPRKRSPTAKRRR